MVLGAVQYHHNMYKWGKDETDSLLLQRIVAKSWDVEV